jgi:hypothetical protein
MNFECRREFGRSLTDAAGQLNSMLSAGSIAKESESKGEELGDVGEET